MRMLTAKIISAVANNENASLTYVRAVKPSTFIFAAEPHAKFFYRYGHCNRLFQ